MEDIFQQEKEHLEYTRNQYAEIIEENREMFQALPDLYRKDPDVLNALLTQTHNRLIRLEQGRDKPYFARIDFTGEAEGTECYYIGKIGVLNRDEQIVTLDWRAPVATLYYDSNVGPVEYTAPSGTVKGRLELKRQLEIEKGTLLSCNDVDTVANDDLLRPYLGVNADNRLKNIIASIQGEQNRIIREGIGRNIVVQGVAGSGKTTVALHRIAYLVYNHREEIRPEQYMVIGPNRFFISYISSVLPDLDVDSVPQYTFSDLAKEVLAEPLEVAGPTATLALAAQGNYHSQIEGLKTSMEYKKALDGFLEEYERSLLPRQPFDLRGVPVFTQEEIAQAWNAAQAAGGKTVRIRIEQCILYLSALVENRALELENRVSVFYREKYKEPAADLSRLHRDRAWAEKELATGCKKALNKFFSAFNTKVLAVYRQFVQEATRWLPEGFEEGEALRKKTLAALRRRTPDGEDLAALLYLKLCIHGEGSYKEFRHAVVDEAQDFGEFEFYVLQRLLSGATFTVVGDLAQAIYSHRSIASWDGVLATAFTAEAQLCQMVKCYRTTVEVMEAANRVTARLGLPPAQPVIRHGKPVGLYQVEKERRAAKIAGFIREFLREGLGSVAVLAKTGEQAQELHQSLTQMNIEAELVDDDTGRYGGGICVMTGYLAKGLEFDGVILADGGENCYHSGSRLDLHLLYVAMTRPLHRLEIVYTGPLCEALAGLESKNNS